MFQKKYRIVSATKPYHRAKYTIEKKLWWWPFWYEATNYSFRNIEDAKEEIEYLKTNIIISSDKTNNHE